MRLLRIVSIGQFVLAEVLLLLMDDILQNVEHGFREIMYLSMLFVGLCIAKQFIDYSSIKINENIIGDTKKKIAETYFSFEKYNSAKTLFDLCAYDTELYVEYQGKEKIKISLDGAVTK